MTDKTGRRGTAGRTAAELDDGDGRLKQKSVRLDTEMIDQVQGLADARGMSFSAVMRAAAEMYLAREVFTVGLADMEERMGATLKVAMRETHRLGDDLQLSIAYVDQLAKFLLMAMPEVIDKEGAVALGNRRYKGFVAEFHKNYDNRRGQSKLSRDLEEMTPGENG